MHMAHRIELSLKIQYGVDTTACYRIFSPVRSTYMLCFRLSDVLDEKLEALARPVVLPARRMAERGQRTGSFVDGLLHLLFSFALTALHCGLSTSTRYFPLSKLCTQQYCLLRSQSLDFLMTGSACGNMVRVDATRGALKLTTLRAGAGLVSRTNRAIQSEL